MGIKWLINFGLITTPFIFLKGMNLRLPKEILALGIVFAIGLLGFNAGIKQFKNKWLLIFLAFTFVSTYFAPHFGIKLFDKFDITNFWIWQSQFYLLVYSLMLIVISGIKFTKKEIELILNIMWICGFVMSLYIFIQYLGFDQFFKITTPGRNPNINYVTTPLLVGTMGNSTVISPYIAMLIPIALYMRKYFFVGCMGTAVWLCDSKVALLAMIISISCFFILKLRKTGIFLICFLILSSGIIGFQYKDKINYYCQHHNNGRFNVWSNIWKDFTSPPLKDAGSTQKFCMTGFGSGSYPYIHPIRFKTRFINAHNDYLEILYNWGIIGLGLFLIALFVMLKDVYRALANYWNERIIALLMSFFCIALCALGTFSWQIGTLIFYTVVIVGFLCNDSIKEADFEKDNE